MEFKIEMPVKIGDKIYTIIRCKIEEYFIESIVFDGIPKITDDLSRFTFLKLERYNNPEDSYKITLPLSLCYMSKEELINQL